MLTLLYHIPNSAFCCSGGLWPPKPSKRNRNQTVKDLLFRSGTRQSPTLVIKLTKIGSTLSPEERPAPAGPAYRGTHTLIDWSNESTKNRRIPTIFLGSTSCQPVPFRSVPNGSSRTADGSMRPTATEFMASRPKDQAAAGHAGFSLSAAHTSRSPGRETLASQAARGSWEKKQE